MSTNLEHRLRAAAQRSAPPRSITQDILAQLPPLHPHAQAQGLKSLGPFGTRRKRALLAATLTATAALVAIAFFLLGTTVRLTLADVQSAVESQKWIHIRWDVGPFREEWINLQTGAHPTINADGSVVWAIENEQTFLHYSKTDGVLERWTFPPATHTAPKWTPRNAWDEIVAPFEKNAATQPTQSPPTVTVNQDTLDGAKVIRFDSYQNDALGHRFLFAQLWTDPSTHLPLRIKTFLQLGSRQKYHQDWATGTYEFPDTGPGDIYALGVPRTAPIKDVTTVAPDVKPILAAIDHCRAQFIKQRYRAIVTVSSKPNAQIDELNAFWRDGEKVHQNLYYVPGEEAQRPSPPFPESPSFEPLISWAEAHHPAVQQMSDGQRDYFWNFGKPKPRVQVMRHQQHPLFDKNAWIEQMQCPTFGWVPDFELAPADADTPPNCLHLRYGTTRQDYRADYYVDPHNDYVCMKKIEWNAFKGQWFKVREYTLSDLHRVAGKIVASHQLLHNFPNPIQGTVEEMRFYTVYFAPATAADIPDSVFDPATLTSGATVVGY